jgi:hypothetical protein
VELLEGKTDQGESFVVMAEGGWAFGPVFSSMKQAQDFLAYIDNDPGRFAPSELRSCYRGWLLEKAQFRR